MRATVVQMNATENKSENLSQAATLERFHLIETHILNS